jgi:NAD(P)-binding Rossmann-like domain
MPSADIHRAEIPLPTLSKLGNPSIPADLDAVKIATEWLSSFANFAEQGDINGILSLIPDSQFTSSSKDAPDTTTTEFAVYWRDMLALTWDFRTFEGTSKIKQFLVDRLAKPKIISNIQLQNGSQIRVVKPYPDLAWIQLSFTFETQSGLGSGIVRLIPISTDGPNSNGNVVVWKAHSIFTNLDDLKGFPEKIGALRNGEPNHGKWEAEREKARIVDKDPVVLIIGGGHSGLGVAARLKALDIPALVIEKNGRIGDNWRTRYEALCLHDPVCEFDSGLIISDKRLNNFFYRRV